MFARVVAIISDVCEGHKKEVAVLFVLTSILSRVVYRSWQSNSSGEEKGECKRKQSTSTAPVTAPAGYIETIRNVASPNAPFFLLEMRLKTARQIFRVNVPLSGGLYVVSNPDAAREILKDVSCDKPIEIYKPFQSVTGDPGIFTRSTYDKMWTSVRKSTAHSFSSTQVQRMNRICTEHTEMWLTDRVQSSVNKFGSFVFDPSEEMTQLTFRSIMESAFEYTSNEQDFETFSHNVEVSLKEFAIKEGGNPFRFLYKRFDPSYYRALQSSKIAQEFVRKVLNTYRNGNDPKRSDATTLVKIICDNKSLTENQKITELYTFMLAGFDTTGYTLSSTLILLAKHPEVQRKLQRELLTLEPVERSKSKYLKCVINESMRLLPVAATGSYRKASRDFTFPDEGGGEIVIPKNAVVAMPFYVQNRDPANFAEPNLFIPERWETNYDKVKGAAIQFAYGARNCPGQSLAMAELYSTIPKILSEYKLELEKEGKLDYFLTLKYVGAKLRASRLESSS
uniref:Cytochrome P450 n=2 Tax=Chaetoceros debilis TaxID=122233 RepID=A0A6S8YL43_9STRA